MSIPSIPILYQDRDICVINKPAGLVVNLADSVKGETVQAWFKSQLLSDAINDWQSLIPPDFDETYGTPEEIFAQRGGIVHRLDKDTSGVMVLAKNPGSLMNLLRQFRLRLTHKEYLCLVHGKLSPAAGVISLPLSRGSRNRQKFTVDPEGRGAVTEYKVESFFPQLQNILAELSNKEWKELSKTYQGFTLVHCWPKTGRTHQIRVHLAAIRHPLVGDVVYVGRKRAKLDPLWCPRQFLHAQSLTFNHPRTQLPVTFKAPMAADLVKALKHLEN